MGMEKESVKNGGGYAGGFFQLFDWKAKSRKKLILSKLDLPENSKRATKGNENMAMAQEHLHFQIDRDESEGGLCSIKINEYSCSSSVTDDEGCGVKAPGVVARLMGLDSLPSSHLCEPCHTPIFDDQSLSLSDVHYHRRNNDYQHDYQIMYSGNLQNKVDVPVRNIVQPKPQKIVIKPMEKFQTEVLPPKSAKSIPATQHKLLSPIKSSGFIPNKNAAHIMEAAAKILESGPRATTKAKLPLLGSSPTPLKLQASKEKVVTLKKVPLARTSVPLKVEDFKEKVDITPKSERLSEISKKPSESNAARILKGKSMNKSWNGSPDTSFRAFPVNEYNSRSRGASSDNGYNLMSREAATYNEYNPRSRGASTDNEYNARNRGKSVSLAIQAKVNVQCRESASTSMNGSLVGQRQQIEIKSSQIFKSQPNVRNNLQAKSVAASGALRNNNQKQNCLMDREKLLSKPSVPNFQMKKTANKDSSFLHQKKSGRANGKSKMGVRKLGIEVTYGDKEDLYCRSKNFPRKKRSIDRDFVFDKSQIMDSVISEKKPTHCHLNTSVDQSCCSCASGTNKATDVVSFTFTSSLTRQAPGSEISAQGDQENYSLGPDHRGKRVFLDSDSMKLTSVEYNVIVDDTQSSHFHKNGRELSESSHRDSIRALSASSSASFLQHLLPNLDAVNTVSMPDGKKKDDGFVNNKFVSQYESGFSLTESPTFRYEHMFERIAEVDECSINSIDSGKLLSFRHPSPMSVLEPSFSYESCNSSMSTESNSTEGSKLWSSVQAQEVDLNSSKLHFVKRDTELLDSASSLSTTEVVVRKHLSMFTVSDHVGALEWELEYIKEILFCDIELMFKTFALGQTHEIISSHQFDQLESRRGAEIDGIESRLQRKVLFDCVSQYVELKWRQLAIGGYKEWERGVKVLKRKECLAEEVYREILGWRGLGNCMVDELVDKDMSSHCGRWLDFGVDAFAIGVEAADQIVSSLVDEVIADFFLTP